MCSGLCKLKENLQKSADQYFTKLAEKMKDEFPKEVNSSFEKTLNLHNCIKDQLKKFDKIDQSISYGISMLNTSKIKNISESFKTTQDKTVSSLKILENKMHSFCDKITISLLPVESIISLYLPDDFGFSVLNDSGLRNNREKTPKMTNNRNNSRTSVTKIAYSPMNQPKRNIEPSREESRENKRNFLQRNNNDFRFGNFEGRSDSLQRMSNIKNKSYNLPAFLIRNDLEGRSDSQTKLALAHHKF